MTCPTPLDPRLLDVVADAWERGWRPADLVHAIGRTTSRLTGLTAAAAVASVAALGTHRDVPVEWQSQLRELDFRAGSAEVGAGVHELLLHVRLLPPIPHLGLPPSRWPRRSTADAGTGPGGSPGTTADGTTADGTTGAGTTADGTSGGAGSPGGTTADTGTEAAGAAGRAGTAGPAADEAAAGRALRRIRALLAKAESTEFPDEAEALTAKAQALMAQHAIDAVLLEADGGTTPVTVVAERRMHLEPPYLDAKMHLVSAVAAANGVRTAWFGTLGIAVLVGTPTELDAVELLATSLLVQAGRAMAAAGRRDDPHARSRGFRRAFLLAYAVRVGERLQESRRGATTEATEAAAARGTNLLPALRRRDEAVTRTFDGMFPRLRTRRTTSVDRSGWLSGRAAADSADLRRKHPLTR